MLMLVMGVCKDLLGRKSAEIAMVMRKGELFICVAPDFPDYFFSGVTAVLTLTGKSRGLLKTLWGPNSHHPSCPTSPSPCALPGFTLVSHVQMVRSKNISTGFHHLGHGRYAPTFAHAL